MKDSVNGFKIKFFVEGFGCCSLFPSPRLSVPRVPLAGTSKGEEAASLKQVKGVAVLRVVLLLGAAHPCGESQGGLQIWNMVKTNQSKTSLGEMRNSVVRGFQEQISQASGTDSVRGPEVPFPEPLIWALCKTTLLLQGFPSLTAIPSS